MVMKSALILALIAGVTTTYSFAGSPAEGKDWYVGGSYNITQTDVAGVAEYDLDTFGLQGGYQITDVIAVEMRAGMGVTDDTALNIDAEIANYVGVYAKFGIPSNTVVYPYVILGFTDFEFDYSRDALAEGGRHNDVSYGFGLSFTVNNLFDIYGEYMRWFDKDEVEIEGFGLGANWRF